jgi:hypothetical protein
MAAHVPVICLPPVAALEAFEQTRDALPGLLGGPEPGHFAIDVASVADPGESRSS